MRLIVTGRDGQIARSLGELSQRHEDVDVVFLARPEFDLADAESAYAAVTAAEGDIVVSAAAYTAVDQAEDERELAYAVNATGAEAVAAAATERALPVIHLSTDYVFSGSGSGRYRERDETDPRSVYGASKLEGERRVAAANPRHTILRTAWVYSPFGKNFVKSMLRLATERDELTIVSDQWGNPTSALDIADAIFHVAKKVTSAEDDRARGIFHFTGTGETNWSGFAEEIMRASVRHGGPHASVKPISTAEFPTKARRPANSRLSSRRFEEVFGWHAPDWRGSTDIVVRRLLEAGRA